MCVTIRLALIIKLHLTNHVKTCRMKIFQKLAVTFLIDIPDDDEEFNKLCDERDARFGSEFANENDIDTFDI